MAIQNNIAHIEAQHASIRRSINIGSVQTHTQHVKRASSDYVLRQLRNRQPLRLAAERLPRAHAAAPSGDGPYVQAPTRPGKSGGGGPFRAFIHRKCSGVCRADFRALVAEYRALSSEERESLVDLGRKAARNHKRSMPSFGPSSRQGQRAEAKRRRDEAHEARRSQVRTMRLADLSTGGAAREQLVLADGQASLSLDSLHVRSWDTFNSLVKKRLRDSYDSRSCLAHEYSRARQEWDGSADEEARALGVV